MITLRQKTLLVMGILVVMGLMFIPFEQAEAQTLPKALTVSWEANPADEQVEWYILQMQKGGEGEWELVTQSSSLSFTTGLDQLPIPVSLGERICFRLVAARGTLRSSPSETNCAVASIGEVEQPPTAEVLSTPVINSITFSD